MMNTATNVAPERLPLFKVLAERVVVRSKKQMSSRKIHTLHRGDVIVVKNVYKSSAKIVEPVSGWVEVRSGKGQILVQKIRRRTSSSTSSLRAEETPERERSWTPRSNSRSCSTTPTNSNSTQSSTQSSRSASETSFSSNIRKSERARRDSILLRNRDEVQLVQVDGTYGTLLGRACDEREVIAEVRLDGTVSKIVLNQDEVLFLAHDPFYFWNRKEITPRGLLRQNTKHNRESTVEPCYCSRRRVGRSSHRVSWVDEEGISDTEEATPFIMESDESLLNIFENLDENNIGNFDSNTICQLLPEMIKRDMLAQTRTSWSLPELLSMNADPSFQQAFDDLFLYVNRVQAR